MPIEPVPGTDRQVRNPSQDACKDRRRSRVFGIVSLRTESWARPIALVMRWSGGFDSPKAAPIVCPNQRLVRAFTKARMPWLNWPRSLVVRFWSV